MPDIDLNIPESLLLLALNDESGERKGTFLNYAITGAAMTELLFQNRIAEVGHPAKNLAIVDPTPTGDPFLDSCLKLMEDKGSDKDARTYVESLGARGEILHPLYDRLTERGIISEHKSKMLLVFSRTTYPEADPAPETALKARLLQAITGEGPVAERDSVIIALALHSEILKYNFDQDVLKAQKSRIKKIADGNLLPPNAAIATIKAMQSAVLIATIVPAFVAATS